MMFNGRPMALADVVPNCDALLLRRVMPSVMYCSVIMIWSVSDPTVPYYTGQWPVYYNHPNTGRPTTESEWTCKYRDAPLFPIYSFGYGLSYTTFAYSDMSVQSEGDKLVVSVKVKNIGNRNGTRQHL